MSKRHVHMLDLDTPSRPRLRKSSCKACVAREAERDRLRGALKEIADWLDTEPSSDDWILGYGAGREAAASIALEALEGNDYTCKRCGGSEHFNYTLGMPDCQVLKRSGE